MTTYGNEYLVGGRSLGNVSLALVNNRAVVEYYELAMAEITRHLGPQAARLFARPELITDRDGKLKSISWFGWTDTAPRSINGLSIAEQGLLFGKLDEQLKELEQLASRSPITRDFLAAALHVDQPTDLVELELTPVILNWGLVPTRIVAQEERLAAHADSVFSNCIPEELKPDPLALSSSGIRSGYLETTKTEDSSNESADTHDDLQPKTVDSEPNKAPLGAVAIAPAAIGWRARCWLFPLLLFLFALLLLLYISWPGNLIYRASSNAGLLNNKTVALAQRATVESLQSRVDLLRKALSEENVCVAAPNVLRRPLSIPPVAPLGSTDPGAASGGDDANPARKNKAPGTAGSDSKADQDSGQQPIAPQSEGAATRPDDTRSLLQRIDDATVIVLAVGGQTLSNGSGFFITPDILLTNRHVIENADPDRIMINNRKLGLKKVKLLARSESGPIGVEDLALLKLSEPADITPFQLTSRNERLTPVIAAGYPSFVVSSDPAFKSAVKNGDFSLLSKVLMATTRGDITSIQPRSNDREIVVHTAQTSPGNSGGPLIDECGRVLGINTYVTSKSDLAIQLNYAQPMSTVRQFLEQHGIDVPQAEQLCQASAAAVGPAAQGAIQTPDKAVSPSASSQDDNNPETGSEATPSTPETSTGD